MPNLLFHAPTEQELRGFLTSQEGLPFTYTEVGCSNGVFPPGYTHDRNKGVLGYGDAVYRRAQVAIQEWQMFSIGWVHIYPPSAPPLTNATVVVYARVLGCWILNSCRVVYEIHSSGNTQQTGFAYGTLPGHLECGEEQFVVSMQQDESVWYEINAFSRPRDPLARLGKPIGRILQRRFARHSIHAMKRFVTKSH